MTKNNDDLITEFETWLSGRDISKYTLRDYPLYTRLFRDFVVATTTNKNNLNPSLLDVTEDTLVAYVIHLRKRPVIQNSIKRYFTGINAFYKFLVRKKYIRENPVTYIQEEYLKSYKNRNTSRSRQVITVDQAKRLVASILDVRERSIVLLLLKTGIRNHELVELDVNDVDLPNLTVYLHPTTKRSNCEIYIDEETAYTLRRWLKQREKENKHNLPALFLTRFGDRLTVKASSRIVRKHAESVGLHDQSSKLPRERLSPHCFRYYFTTRMRDARMRENYVQYLRGDGENKSMDVYTEIDKADVKREYLAKVPQLDII